MGELTYKADDLGTEIEGNVKQTAMRASNRWRLKGEAMVQERKGKRPAFLGKVTSRAGN